MDGGKGKPRRKEKETSGARGWNRYSRLLHRGVFFTTGVFNISLRRKQVSFFSLSTTTHYKLPNNLWFSRPHFQKESTAIRLRSSLTDAHLFVKMQD
jgi:hypothetical protein